jgi:hypothetical protein
MDDDDDGQNTLEMHAADEEEGGQTRWSSMTVDELAARLEETDLKLMEMRRSPSAYSSGGRIASTGSTNGTVVGGAGGGGGGLGNGMRAATFLWGSGGRLSYAPLEVVVPAAAPPRARCTGGAWALLLFLVALAVGVSTWAAVGSHDARGEQPWDSRRPSPAPAPSVPPALPSAAPAPTPSPSAAVAARNPCADPLPSAVAGLGVEAQEAAALSDLFHCTRGPSHWVASARAGWIQGLPCGSPPWQGVACELVGNTTRVTQLMLQNSGGCTSERGRQGAHVRGGLPI